jgi:predicted ATPase
MLAYLTLLYDPNPPQLIGIEEPENQIHPRLLIELVEECRKASSRSQLMITTHSPHFVNGLNPQELWVLHRDEAGFTKAKRASDMKGIPEFIREGAKLGDLWMEGHFEYGNPPSGSVSHTESAMGSELKE